MQHAGDLARPVENRHMSSSTPNLWAAQLLLWFGQQHVHFSRATELLLLLRHKLVVIQHAAHLVDENVLA